jgi:hypothetical protein
MSTFPIILGEASSLPGLQRFFRFLICPASIVISTQPTRIFRDAHARSVTKDCQ